MRVALYWGYGRHPGGGHVMVDPVGRIWDPKKIPGFPWTPEMIDGGILTSRLITDIPDGRVWTGTGGIAVLWRYFTWWDRSGDPRASSNSGLYVRGFQHYQALDAFEFACNCWKAVVDRQQVPLALQL